VAHLLGTRHQGVAVGIGNQQSAESRKQKAEGKTAESKRQKSEGRRRKSEGRKQTVLIERR
jgi:hypothetical protein